MNTGKVYTNVLTSLHRFFKYAYYNAKAVKLPLL